MTSHPSNGDGVRLLLLIPLLPFLGFLINATIGRRMSKGVSGTVAMTAIGLSFGISAAMVWQLLHSEPVNGVRAFDYTLYTWFSSGSLTIPFRLYLDPLSA